LFAAGLISAPPPQRWQDVQLDAPKAARPPIIRYEGVCTPAFVATMRFPDRRARDPYAALRALHQSDG
jgi:hypothetical protein